MVRKFYLHPVDLERNIGLPKEPLGNGQITSYNSPLSRERTRMPPYITMTSSG